MSVQQRLAKLGRTQSGDDGAGVWGLSRIDDATGIGPDVVTVAATGETMTAATFGERYPRGLLLVRREYGVAETSARARSFSC